MFRKLLYPGLVAGFMSVTWLVMQRTPAELQELVPGLLSFPAIGLIFWLERYMPRRKKWLRDVGDGWTDLLHTFLFFPIVLKLAQLAANAVALKPLEIFPKETSIWLVFPSMLIVAELFFYAIHRSAHTFMPLWRFHRVHHGAPRVYWANAATFHPFDLWLTMTIYFLPFFFIALPKEAFVLLLAANVITGLLEHANIDFEAGAFNYIFNTAQLHRWHHSTLMREADRNFGKVLCVWDVILGTWYLEPTREVKEVGLSAGEKPVPHDRFSDWITGGPAFARSFELFRDLGYDTTIVFARHKNGRNEEITVSHVDYDGINGLTHMLFSHDALLPDSFPAIPPRKQGFPPLVWLRRFLQYFRVLWQFSRKNREWQRGRANVKNMFCVWRFLSHSETQRLREAARLEGVSLNSYLLYHLNASVLPKLKSSKLPATWIVPVSLYREYESALHKGLKTSIMEVSLDEKDTPATAHAKVKHEVDIESYWGSIVGVLINQIFPDAVNRKILASTVATKKRVGTFSNLGRWKGAEKTVDEAWSVVPPVHPGQPVGVGAIEFNGKLGLGMKVDPSIGIDKSGAKALLDSVLRGALVVEESHV